jgi:alpha-beta hydrolase superfamily lysophospholipase
MMVDNIEKNSDHKLRLKAIRQKFDLVLSTRRSVRFLGFRIVIIVIRPAFSVHHMRYRTAIMDPFQVEWIMMTLSSRALFVALLVLSGAWANAPAVCAKAKVAPAAKPVRLKIQVPCRAWVPQKIAPKAVLLCVHGLGLNSESFQEFGKQMQADGIATFAVDVRGFGTWMKLKGKQKCDFNSCLSDVVQALTVLHTAYPNKPIFLLGESMGGAIAMRVAAEHQDLVDGLISSVPSGDRFHTTKNQLRVALNLVTFRANKPIDVGTGVIDDATHNAVERAKWEDDPFNRLKLSSKELIQFQHFMSDNHDTAKQIDKIPVLFLVGLKDKLVKPEGTRELYNEIRTEDKKLVTIRSSEHLIFENHKISPDLKKVLTNWLLTHNN